jgi:hypothetical protein
MILYIPAIFLQGSILDKKLAPSVFMGYTFLFSYFHLNADNKLGEQFYV